MQNIKHIFFRLDNVAINYVVYYCKFLKEKQRRKIESRPLSQWQSVLIDRQTIGRNWLELSEIDAQRAALENGENRDTIPEPGWDKRIRKFIKNLDDFILFILL